MQPYILAWMLAHPGPHRRDTVVHGVVACGPWTVDQRARPCTTVDPSRFASQLHQQAWFRMWHMRREQRLLETPERGQYILSRAGLAAAQEPGALPVGASGLRRVGRPFGDDIGLPDQRAGRTVVFEYDPDERDRQTREHEVLVRRLRLAVEKLGAVPLLPNADDPRFDLAFVREDGESLALIEVKSLSDEHATHQLRLGLGQVLQYRQELSAGRSVVAALAVPWAPPSGWREVCGSVGVELIVAPDFAGPLARMAALDD